MTFRNFELCSVDTAIKILFRQACIIVSETVFLQWLHIRIEIPDGTAGPEYIRLFFIFLLAKLGTTF